MKAQAPFCPECSHCAAAKAAEASGLPAPAIRLRPWEFPSYGRKITSIVDYFDGTAVGERAATRDEGVPPEPCIDKRQWLVGFLEGFKDAERTRSAIRAAGR